MYSDEHRNLVKSFHDICYWNYEIWSVLRVMCGYSYTKIDYHMYRVIIALKEYWILQVQKLFDSKYHRKGNKKIPNLVLEYIIDEVPWPEEVKENLCQLKETMKPFSDFLEDARNKVIAHHDLKVLTEQRGEWFGTHTLADEERFYESLLVFLNTIQAAIDSSPPLEWPPFAYDDAEQFMMILTRAGCAHVDNT